MGLLPGIRLNFSKSANVSMGERGLLVTVGPRGTRTTFGVPVSGVSYTSYGKSRSLGAVAFWLLMALLVYI